MTCGEGNPDQCCYLDYNIMFAYVAVYNIDCILRISNFRVVNMAHLLNGGKII